MLMEVVPGQSLRNEEPDGEISARRRPDDRVDLQDAAVRVYVERLKPVLQSMFASIQSGDCLALQQVHDVLVGGCGERVNCQKILGPDTDSTDR